LLENVAALTSRGLDRVHGELAQIGYCSESHCIPAASVGAPHIRDRVFVVGSDRDRILRESECNREPASIEAGKGPLSYRAQPHRSGSNVAHTPSQGPLSGTHTRGDIKTEGSGAWLQQPERSGWWATEPDVGRVAHGIPSRVDRLRGLGNAVVPQVAEFIGRQIIRATEQQHPYFHGV